MIFTVVGHLTVSLLSYEIIVAVGVAAAMAYYWAGYAVKQVKRDGNGFPGTSVQDS
jgi:hypothetical protein